LVNRIGAQNCLRCKSSLNQSAASQVSAQEMTWSEVSTMDRPLWVMVGLWGLGTRSVAWAFVVLSILVATGAIIFWSWLGAMMYLAALWYWLAIRWVDKNDSW
jgi:hypothetical protein